MRAATLALARRPPRAAVAAGIISTQVASRWPPLGLAVRHEQFSTERTHAFISDEIATAQEFGITPPFQPADSRKGVCVAGAGRMGHIRALGVTSNAGTFLSSVVDPDQQRAKTLAQHLSVPAYWSLDDALTDPTCDAVWVSGPTRFHKECIRSAAEAGKAVAVEKPVAASVEDILECHKICEANDVPLYCSFQRRTDRTYAELAAAVRNGAVGDVRSVHAVFRDHPVPPIEFLKQGGDIFHDLAPHDIDFVCFSLGLGEPSEVYATANSFLQRLRDAGVKDSAHCMITFPSGAVFTMEMTRCSAYGYDNRIEVMGEKGMLSLGNPPSSGLELYDSRGCATAPPDYSFPQRFREAFADEVASFEQALRGKSEPLVTCHDSCRTTHIAEHASISARTGRPVPISFEGMETAVAATGSK